MLLTGAMPPPGMLNLITCDNYYLMAQVKLPLEPTPVWYLSLTVFLF